MPNTFGRMVIIVNFKNDYTLTQHHHSWTHGISKAFHYGNNSTYELYGPIGIFLPGTELLDSPVRTKFSTESFHAVFFWLTIIITIIKKDWQCKAGRGKLTPYQSEDPSLTIPTYREKEKKGKMIEEKKGESN